MSRGSLPPPLIRYKAKKGKAGRLIAPMSNAATRAMQQHIAAANSLRAACRFTFAGSQPDYVDFGMVHLHRRFTDSHLNCGGRFHGGWWLMLPKKDRQRIRMDGEDVAELDYRSCQPRICFHLDGSPLPPENDPYAVPGFPPETYREAIKATVAQLMLFGPDSVRRPKEHKALFPTNAGHASFVAAVAAAFAPISHWFGAEKATELEHIESEIACAVVAELTRQGIPCLPIHDGFIVPRSAEAALGRAMNRAYCDQLFDRTGIAAYPPIWGWSGAEIEADVIASLPPLASPLLPDTGPPTPITDQTAKPPSADEIAGQDGAIRRAQPEPDVG